MNGIPKPLVSSIFRGMRHTVYSMHMTLELICESISGLLNFLNQGDLNRRTPATSGKNAKVVNVFIEMRRKGINAFKNTKTVSGCVLNTHLKSHLANKIQDLLRLFL